MTNRDKLLEAERLVREVRNSLDATARSNVHAGGSAMSRGFHQTATAAKLGFCADQVLSAVGEIS